MVRDRHDSAPVNNGPILLSGTIIILQRLSYYCDHDLAPVTPDRFGFQKEEAESPLIVPGILAFVGVLQGRGQPFSLGYWLHCNTRGPLSS